MFGKRKEKGQSMVEFMLVLPISLLVLWGIVAFGLGFAYLESVENAAAEGGRAAQRWNVNSVDASCVDAVNNAIGRATPWNVTTTVSASCPSSPGVRISPNTEIVVTVVYDYQPYFFGTLFNGNWTVSLTASVAVVHE
jgi:Flp pilus assembly protein TadG